AGCARYWDDIHASKPCRGHEPGYIRGDFSPPVPIREIGFGERHDAIFDAEQIDDGEMLDCLRHDAVIGGYDKKDEVDACRPGKHIMDEALMSRHIDKAEHITVAPRQIGEAEIDRDTARLLLLEAIGVDAGERADK